jgi:hypothetical protein
MPKCECLSIHPFLPFGPLHHAIPQIQRKQSFCRTEANYRPQAFLPNLRKKPFPTERNLLPSLVHKSASFLYQFLVLTYALQLRDKSDFIPKLTVNANIFKSNLFNTYSLPLQSIGVSVQIQTLSHLFPKLKSSMADQNQAAQVNFIPLRFIWHNSFRLQPQISSSVSS